MSNASVNALIVVLFVAAVILAWRLIEMTSPPQPSYGRDRYEYARDCVESRGWPEVNSNYTRDWQCHEINWKINRE